MSFVQSLTLAVTYTKQTRRVLRAFEERQRNATALENLASAKFIFLRMNPAAGLGNRMVALVSGFLLSLVTEVDRFLLTRGSMKARDERADEET